MNCIQVVLIFCFYFQGENVFGKELFNVLNAQFEPLPSIVHSEELREDHLYEVSAIRGVLTKFGAKIVVDLCDYGTLFLPNRYVKRFLKEGSDPRRLKITCENTSVKLIGRENDKYNTPIFEFIDTENTATQKDEEIFHIDDIDNGGDGGGGSVSVSFQAKKKRSSNNLLLNTKQNLQ